jgi:hypothetical protein
MAKAMKIVGCVIVGLIAIGACNAATDDGGTKAGTDNAKPTASSDAKTEDGVEKARTQAEEFTACVNQTGTATEKKAVKHVTKVTGADKQNNVFDNAEVFTDFTGGLMSDDQGAAKLVATAFTSCYESDNGLVTVYGEDGQMIANAQF